ncbi:MAG: DUF4190 domain-containing protein [Planctomycetia bacterium]|nr:DUF4190 domain-containing protein [Planctomycetia bacterium]
MASPIITPLPVQTDTEYRPISRMAVAGLILAIPSMLIFAMSSLWWLLILVCLPAAIISIMALRQIRQSEGNLAGEAVAMLAIVISVGCGLGWITMVTVTKYITENEAKSAVDQWIYKMQHNEPGAAFLLMMSPRKREITYNPEDYGRLRRQFPTSKHVSQFDNFLIDPICGILMRYRDQASLTYDMLLETKTLNNSTSYKFRYLLNSPIGNGSCVISAVSEDYLTDAGVRRDWFMSIDNNATQFQHTSYGEQLMTASNRAQLILERFVFAIANDEKEIYEPMLSTNNRGDFSTVLGYIRPQDKTGPVFLSLQKPMRLRSDKLDGKRWTLNFDCTTVVENSRGVDFSVICTTDDINSNKWIMNDIRFLGMKRLSSESGMQLITPIDAAPAAPKAPAK